ncbi:hypothetical protein [Bradyrhizobium sp. RD5-C2]|uniref:hypothetical protein n=1 Tax=Bradyrhizobium sp. RD5-C2 TaxID=244562 RepID=UPI001CC60636|nr:hypothetical protein [Bradyrhizobium sp. RD5-C2]GIQ77096.1 hypothetical protein BraRD5C2_55440 [Bradyrhizobium sp. RD5-C2]
MNSAPPGWRPDQIATRIDGWVVDPDDETHIPAAVAQMIARAMPHPSNGAIADIRTRMLARHKKVLGHV